MKNGFFKIALCAPMARVADTEKTLESCLSLAREAAEGGANILLFPELTLSSKTAGDLFLQDAFLDKCLSALERFKDETAGLDIVSFIGFPYKVGGSLYNAVAAVCRGEIIGVSTGGADGTYFSLFGEVIERKLFGKDTLIGDNIIYSFGKAKIFVEVGDDAHLPIPPSSVAASSGANIILGAMAYPEYLTLSEREERRVLAVSESLSVSYAVCSASLGESGTDGLYAGRRLISEEGKFVAKAPLFSEEIVYGVIDTERSAANRRSRYGFDSLCRDFEVCEFTLSEKTVNPDKIYPFPGVAPSEFASAV